MKLASPFFVAMGHDKKLVDMFEIRGERGCLPVRRFFVATGSVMRLICGGDIDKALFNLVDAGRDERLTCTSITRDNDLSGSNFPIVAGEVCRDIVVRRASKAKWSQGEKCVHECEDFGSRVFVRDLRPVEETWNQ